MTIDLIKVKLLNFVTIPLSFKFSDQKSQISGEEQERKINTYEEAMSKIKDATGVSDIQVSLFCLDPSIFFIVKQYIEVYTMY